MFVSASNVATEAIRVSRQPNFQHQGAEPTASQEAEDLQRLQTVVEWLNRERMIATLETAVRKQSARLRRAASPGISPVEDFEQRKAGSMPFVLAPPLASDRLRQPLPRRRPLISDTTLFVLAMTMIMGLIGYWVAESSSSVLEMAQAALSHAP